MELNNDEQIVNAEQFFFNTVLEQNVNTKYSFDENDTNFNQSIDTNTVSIKEETADSVFVEEDRLLETKIKIEDHDYHNAPCLFDRRFYYNENNSIQNDLDTTSKSVKSAKDFDNFFTDDLKQSIKIDCSSTASADCGGDYTESIDWKPAVENNTDFENFNKSFLMSEVSLNNFNESNPWEIFNEEKCVLERYTEKKANAVELYVYLQQHDLYELQRHFRKNQSQSNKSEEGIWYQWNNAERSKTFSCPFCQFKFDAKFKLTEHIIENHKDVAKMKNVIEAQYMMPGSSPDEILFKCNQCFFISEDKSSFKLHLLIHKSVDKSQQTFRCASCPFVAKNRPLIINHMMVHIPAERQHVYKCPHCEFRTKHMKYIRCHVRNMHNPEKQEGGRYKCPQCPYQTNRLYVLEKIHSLKHTSDEAKVHACALCPYKAKWKKLLKKHMLTHKTPDEVIMYKCDLCPFSTKRKDSLAQHEEIHVEVSAEDRIPCSLCPFKAKNRYSLRRHMRTHLDPSQITIHRCDQCTYQNRKKSLLMKHSVTHKKREELPTFQCDLCEYRTFWESYLQLHRKTMHTKLSEIDWKRCKECDFKTKTSTGLKRHSIIHKEPEELEIFQCAQCSFSTKWKHHLKEHMVIHTNIYYNCPMCNFKTKHRSSLYNHKKVIHEKK